MLFCTSYSNLVLHSFFSIICPDSVCVFLIIAFVYCDIVERVSFSNRQVFTQIPVRQLQSIHCKNQTDEKRRAYLLVENLLRGCAYIFQKFY